MLTDCELQGVTCMRVLPKNLWHNPLIMLGSSNGEVQIYNAKDYRAFTRAISLSIQPICDIQFTPSAQHMIVAYSTGQVNLHQLDQSLSLNYIAQLQSDFTAGIFQKVCVFSLDGCDYACMLGNGPNMVNIKRIAPRGQPFEVFREFDAACNIYDFEVHRSLDYLLVLTELGRVYVYK